MNWEYFFYRIELLLMLFGLFPLLLIEGIKIKLENKETTNNDIDIYIMGVQR